MHELLEPLGSVWDGLRQHLELGWAPDARITAALILGSGLTLALWGGKLIRAAIVLACAGLGVWGGLHGAHLAGVSPAAGMLAGGGLGGVAGFFLYRLWVGLLSAATLAVIGLGIVSYQRILPHLSDYDATVMVVGSTESGTFALPTPQEQRRLLDTDPAGYLRGLWSYVSSRQPRLAREVLLVVAAGTFLGVTLGLLLPGLVTVLGSCVMGTLLVAGSLWWAAGQYCPQVLQFLTGQPKTLIGLPVAFCLLSMLIQWRCCRSTGTARRRPAPAAV